MAIKNDLIGGVDNQNGEVIDANDVNDTNNEMITTGLFGNVPIGVILPWHKDFTNTPTLPSTWMECNGQEVTDSESPYFGQTLPDLNNPVSSGLKGRFLRGHTISGILENDELKSHSHNVYTYTGVGDAGLRTDFGRTLNGNMVQATGGNETRPYNFSVVMIIRVK